MSATTMSFKARINNYAKTNHIPAQVVLQNVMFERFLERLSVSPYRDRFVLKGGMLISTLVGLDTRTTMDLDATVQKLALTEEQIRYAIEKISEIDLQDDVYFSVCSIEPIRKDDIYGGYRVKIEGTFGEIKTPFSIDVSAGDVITPGAVRYECSGILDDRVRFTLWGYNIETVLAEKVETILSRGVLSTRPRDFYDVYILDRREAYNGDIFRKALFATAMHRGSWDRIRDHNPILGDIERSKVLKENWEKYRKAFPYASDIAFEDTIATLKRMLG